MEHKLNPEAKRLLFRLLQKEFPLSKRPFLAIAKRVGLKEVELISLLRDWEREGRLRQISAIFNPEYFGHRSSLFALKVSEKKLSLAIDRINSHPGVSHNYLRNHEYNLWFTLVVPKGKDLLEEAKALCQEFTDNGLLFLPILKKYKISVVFEVEQEGGEDFQSRRTFNFTEDDVRMVKALQEPLPLVKEPFLVKAEELNCKIEDIFAWLKKMKRVGALRRFGALFKHERLGYKHNVMVVWQVEEKRVDEVAKSLSKIPEITHCYLRKSYPEFPYNLYTMCHFKEENFQEKIKAWAHTLGVKNYLPLETLKELKKVRLKLFYDRNFPN